MKKIYSMLLVIAMLCGMCVLPAGAEVEKEICSAVLMEAYDSSYIQPFYNEFNDNFGIYSSNVGKTYLDGDEMYSSTFVYESIMSLWQEYALNNNDPITKQFVEKFSEDKWEIHCTVYPTNLLEKAYLFKFNLNLWDVLNNCDDSNFLLSADDEYIVIKTYGRGERMPGALPVIEKVQKLSDSIFYCKGYITNSIYKDSPSSQRVYIIFEKGRIEGKDIIGYRYLSVTSPSDKLLAQYTHKEKAITVTLNNDKIQFDQEPIIKDDRTLVPMRAIFEAMGCDVYWDEEYQEVDVWQGDENVMTLWVDDNEMWTPNGNIMLDVPPQIVNDRTLVPVRAISESMGAKVEWDGDLRLVNIYYYPNYSGTTTNEYYYRNQSEIVNFGYFLEDNPYYAGEDEYSYYFYTYDSETDIEYCINEYFEAMEYEGFEVEFIENSDSYEYYIINGNGYQIHFIYDYLQECIQIGIEE